MTPLKRTVTFAQVDGTALAIAEHLNFDVARRCKVFFDIDFVVAKIRLAFSAGRHESPLHVSRRLRYLHAFATTAGRRLDDNGITNFFTDPLGISQSRDPAVRSRHTRHSEFLHSILGGDLVTHDTDMCGSWADKRQAVVFDNLHEARIFR